MRATRPARSSRPPFENAAVITLDGWGEWATSSIGVAEGNKVELLQQLFFPALAWAACTQAFTSFCGFRVNSASTSSWASRPMASPRYAQRIRDHLLDLRDDGSFSLNMKYFGFVGGRSMTSRGSRALRRPAREPETEITRREMDLARSIQA
jgi:carbamoyltransferase